MSLTSEQRFCLHPEITASINTDYKLECSKCGAQLEYITTDRLNELITIEVTAVAVTKTMGKIPLEVLVEWGGDEGCHAMLKLMQVCKKQDED